MSPRTKAHSRRAPARHAVRARRRSRSPAQRSGCRWSRTRRARSAARFSGTAAGSASAGRAATSPASRFIRASCCRPATAACSRRGRQARCTVPAAAAAWHERARHGPSRLVAGRVRGPTPSPGFNYRMTDIQAAIGREQLTAPAGHRRAAPRARRAICRRVCAAFAGVDSRASRRGRAPTGRATRSGWRPPLDQRRSCSACSTRASPPAAA